MNFLGGKCSKCGTRISLAEKEERLESRIEALRARYARQYSAMESAIASFKETGNMLFRFKIGERD